MSLSPGARLGVYEIVAKIGEGGMGEVYRAKDTKLGRAVALKFLPDIFSNDPERLARFQREAHLLASLNHSNIAAIYGLEDAPAFASDGASARQAARQEGSVFLIMELVEGEDLSQRIARGAIPLEEALPIATQIAEALEAAHEQGIVHRDLKPANIKVRPDGTVKILDFGLAKALEGPAKAGHQGMTDLSHSPTITSPAQMTSVGVILGTAAYMAPEQAKGRPVDKRADIWAFGAVLFEMLTGRRCFPGDDLSDTFAAILRADPEWNALPAATPAAIRRLLRRCLEKDSRWRLSDMTDVRIELRDAQVDPGPEVSAAPTAVQRPRSLLRTAAPYAAVIVAALATGAAVWRIREPVESPRPLTRFSIDLPDQPSTPGRNPLAISPDGTHIAYVANQRLYLRALDQLEATAVAGTETGGSGGFARDPFFSPDNQWIGFWQEGQLRKAAVSGGAAVTICGGVPIPPVGISWEPDGILWQSANAIMRVPAAGGTPETLLTLKEGDRLATPQMLPGGEWLLFTYAAPAVGPDQSQAVVQSRKTGERRVLIDSVRDVRYLPSGHLLYARGPTLLAQRFDVSRLTLSGGTVPVLDGVANAGNISPAVFEATSSTGTLIYIPGSAVGPSSTRLAQVARDGKRSPVLDIQGMTWFPRFSPDGSRVAYAVSPTTQLNDPSDLWVLDLARGARTRVTFTANNRFYPIWTRDGLRLTFADGSESTNRVLTAPADGSGGIQTLLDVGTRRYPTSWSPDGKTLALYVGGAGGIAGEGTRDIVMLRADDDKHVLVPFVATPFEERGAIFSPDGRWVAYVSNKSGQNDVYARPYPGPGNEITISVGGGQEPVWGPSGRELFYRHDGKLQVVSIEETGASLKVGSPAVLFDDPFRLDTGGAQGGMANYDISPDGKRFVFVEEPRAASAGTQPVRLQVILNWFDELKRRTPIQ